MRILFLLLAGALAPALAADAHAAGQTSRPAQVQPSKSSGTRTEPKKAAVKPAAKEVKKTPSASPKSGQKPASDVSLGSAARRALLGGKSAKSATKTVKAKKSAPS